jgi:hypothetical protein
VLVSALEQLTADAPTWLAKVYISRCFTKVFTLCDDPLHQVCFIGGLHIGVYIIFFPPFRILKNVEDYFKILRK